jgi:hypothetical protein
MNTPLLLPYFLQQPLLGYTPRDKRRTFLERRDMQWWEERRSKGALFLGVSKDYRSPFQERLLILEVCHASGNDYRNGTEETRTCTVYFEAKPSAWKAAYRIARILSNASPAHKAQLSNADCAACVYINIPYFLRNSYEVV